MFLSRLHIRKKRLNLQEEAAAPPNLRQRPRLIGRDRHRLLSHAERAGWIGGKRELLAVWRDYAEDFIRSRPILPVEQRTWLMSHGFDIESAWLYHLPGVHAESYVSTLQSRLLPQINGLDAPLLANRTLFMQTFRDQLPWPVPLAQAIGGRMLRDEAGMDAWLAMTEGRRSCVRPAFVSNGAVAVMPAGTSPLTGWPEWLLQPSSPHTNEAAPDSQMMGLPPVSDWLGDCDHTHLHRFKMLLMRDPRSRTFSLIAACVVIGSHEGRFGPDTLSLQIDPTSGQPRGAVYRLDQAVTHANWTNPWNGSPLPEDPAPGWHRFVEQLIEALNGLPLLEWLQVEADLSAEGFIMLDATDVLDAPSYQVHQPLMEHALCRRFMMEYCL